MREQLIEWLVDDILPKVKQSGDAEGEILKFAGEQNLAPALVETLGHLYNTSKSLSYMEKSANRGGDFDILNVERLMAKYIDVPDRHKLALKQASAEEDNPARDNLHEYFMDARYGPMNEEAVPAEKPAGGIKQAKNEHALGQVCMEFCKQAQFEFLEDQRRILKDIESSLRRRPDVKFADIEQEFLDCNGHEEYRPWTDKIAAYLKSANWPVERAGDPVPNRLIDDHDEVFDKMGEFVGLAKKAVKAYTLQQEYEQSTQKKANEAGLGKPEDRLTALEQHESQPLKEAAPGAKTRKSQPGPKIREDDLGSLFGFGQSKPVDRPSPSPSPSGDQGGDKGPMERLTESMGGVLDSINRQGQSLRRTMTEAVRQNPDQEAIDKDYQNARQIATLQNLMVTDEQIAEHDPDRVMEIFKTVREASPSIASDPNMLRVVMRHALQYEGIQPFEVKQWLEGEVEKQKKDEGERRRQSELYNQGSPEKSVRF